MAQRKINQEIDKCFKAVAIGVEAFDAQYEKYEQSTNASQRDKLVENIKKECKKLQRLRDQIKTWAAGNEVKDKAALQEKRELIETKMEAFKAVEKEMKTKAFSKEGLTAAAKLDPREKEKEEMIDFLSQMVEELDRQIESLEAETEQLLAQAKKSKKDNAKAERAHELEEKTERHKWHQKQLELLMRSLANDSVEPEQVKNSEEDIRHYVENNQEVDFIEDDGIYDEFNLDEESGKFGVQPDMDRVSSHDTQSAQDEVTETTASTITPVVSDASKSKVKPTQEPQAAPPSGRRPSQHIKSPLPALATLHTTPSQTSASVTAAMKPAPPPSKPPGETLKYASAAAAAAVSAEASGIGIAPLPPPPSKSAIQATVTAALSPSPSVSNSKPSQRATSPSAVPQPTEPISTSTGPSANDKQPVHTNSKSPVPSQSSIGTPSPAVSATQLNQAAVREEAPPLPSQPSSISESTQNRTDGISPQVHDRAILSDSQPFDRPGSTFAQTNGVEHVQSREEESVYHLPASLQELVDSFEAVKNAVVPATQPQHQHQLASSYATRPDTFDAEKPRHYKPQNENLSTPSHYPQEPLPIFDDPRLYSKVDTDALFYSFYYRQGTHQQYLAAKALKQQSWRFHKQYQTWFQRHEEPKSITEDYEQGTYRFFDYESTWMNRRKADFKFAYKFLEDDL